jgi:hypothetical protein
MNKRHAIKEGYREGILKCRVCGNEELSAIYPPPINPNKQECSNCGNFDNDWEDDPETKKELQTS